MGHKVKKDGTPLKKTRKMLQEISWEEFQATGLLLMVNSFLHIFNLAIVLDRETVAPFRVLRVYPAKCAYRGFSEKLVTEAYKKLAKYMGTVVRDEKEYQKS